MKMLPGEAKLLKVDILRPGQAEGFLDHSNQSKLIEYPSNANGDSIRYHMVFFKLQPGTDRNRVCYRRSKPFKKDDPSENIIWEREYLLSDTVIKPNLVGSDSLHCDYPSIVLRKSGTTLKAYIVYSCNSEQVASADTISYISENIISFNNDEFSNLQDTIGRVIAQYKGIDRSEWGNPVINASYGGNYYAWSDSSSSPLKGYTQIVSAWKAPDSLYFQDSNKDSISFCGISWNLYYLFKHPSLNVYSNINMTEDNCALVFQSYWQIATFLPPSENGCDVFYTRLRKTSNGLKHYVPDVFADPSFKVDTFNFVAKLTDFKNADLYYHTFPTVIRNLRDYNFATSNFINRQDRVYWQAKSIDFGIESIQSRAINLVDTSNVPRKWKIYPYSNLLSRNQWLQQPNLNNGHAINEDGNVVGDQLIMNFVSTFRGQSPSSNSDIWQYPHYLSSLLTRNNLLEKNPLTQKMFTGQQPHLSNRNYADTAYTKIWRNRRVYEFDTTSPPKIMSSAKFFYKMISQNEQEGDALVGFTNDSTLYYINLPLLDGLNLPIHLPYTAINDSIYETFYERYETDTLYSDWFSVGDEAQLVFKCYGYDTSRVAMKIHEQNTANYIDLSLPSYTTDSTGILREFTLYNGQGMNYRLEFTKRDTTAHYSEQLIIDGLPVPDTMRKATAMFGIPIDLQGQSYHNQGNQLKLNVFPNPTDDNIYATVYLPIEMVKSSNSLIIKVFSTLGFELFRQEVKSGETLSIDTRSYPPGAYFIRAEEKIDSFDKLPAVIENFIIQR